MYGSVHVMAGILRNCRLDSDCHVT